MGQEIPSNEAVSQKIDNHIKVLKAVENHVREVHQVCSIEDIKQRTGLSLGRCKAVLDHLLSNSLVMVYGKGAGRGKIKLYLPRFMWEEVLRAESKPDWVDEIYSFEEENEILAGIQDKHQELNKFAKFKRLLYGIGTPLEEAVAFSLEYLGFDKVKHLGGEDEHDVEFVVGKIKYIGEVGGSSNFIKKDKPKDLTEWLKKAALREENDVFELKGILFVNPYNETRPSERGRVFSQAAKRLIKVFDYKTFTTPTLFELVRSVHYEKIKKEDARRKLFEGEGA